MTEFNRSQVFNGSCAPFIYIEGCTSRAKQDYLIAARFWVAANSLALIAMVVVFIRRYLRVKERFNTLRLAMICFAAGLPLHIIMDALRAGDVHQHGVPIPIYGFLFLGAWVPPVTGLLLLIVTWVSFSSKSLMLRPALTGNPVLFWSLLIPFALTNILGGFLSGVNYWWYWVTMRVVIASWSALFVILGFFAGYYGRLTLKRINATRNSFNYKQQLRMLIMMMAIFIACGICVTLQAYFLSQIDQIPGVFLLISSVYRISAWALSVGSSIYVWIATTHYVTTSSHSSGTTGKSYSDRSRAVTRASSAIKATAPRNDVADSSDEDDDDTTTTASTADAALASANALNALDTGTGTAATMEEEDEEEEDDAEVPTTPSSSNGQEETKSEENSDASLDVTEE